jgi:hypothetical protein
MEQGEKQRARTGTGGNRGYEQGDYLRDHLVPEDLLLVEDLDGDILAGVDVPGELDLGEGALPEGPPQLVPPHPRPPHGHAHLLLLKSPRRRPTGERAKKRRGLYGAAGSGSVNLPATRPSARGLRPLGVAGPPLHEQPLALLALLPLPHQDPLWCLSAGPAAAGMEWDDGDWPGD